MIFSGKRPDNLGVKDGQLASIPNSPNCVSSQGASGKHAIEPFQFNGTPAEEMLRLKDIMANMKGITIITFNKNYIYAECKTPIMGFVDDLEFYWDSKNKICHVRSASRLGRSDFNKNRSRVEEIRTLFKSM